MLPTGRELRGMMVRGDRHIVRTLSKVAPADYLRPRPELRPHMVGFPVCGAIRHIVAPLMKFGVVVYRCEAMPPWSLYGWHFMPRCLRMEWLPGYVFQPPASLDIEGPGGGMLKYEVVDVITIGFADEIRNMDRFFAWRQHEEGKGFIGPNLGVWSETPLQTFEDPFVDDPITLPE